MESSGEKVLLSPHVLCNQHVFKHGELGEQADILEGTGNALIGNHVRGMGNRLIVHAHVLPGVELFHLAPGEIFHNGLAQKIDLAVGGFIHAGDTVEDRGFSGAVGADQRHNLTLVHIQVQVIDGHNAAELHGHIFNMQHVLSHFLLPPFSPAWQRAF